MPRIREYPPSLTDAIVVISTASTDISLVTRSKTPLNTNLASEDITNVFVATTMMNDSRRAELPMTEKLDSTSSMGVAFDLSSKDKVKRPLPGEEYEESPGPLPALKVLNNEGTLSTWWLVYSESIRQGKLLPSLTAVDGGVPDASAQTQQQSNAFGQPALSTTTFGQNSFGTPATSAGALGAPATASSGPTFGSTSTPNSAFGAPSGLGQELPLGEAQRAMRLD